MRERREKERARERKIRRRGNGDTGIADAGVTSRRGHNAGFETRV